MSTIRIDITHIGLGLELRELAFQATTTLKALKEKLYPKTGTEPGNMLLTLVDPATGNRTDLFGDELTLDEFGLVTGSRLDLCDSNDASVSNTLFAEEADAKPVPKAVAQRGDSGFANFRKEAAAAAAAAGGGVVSKPPNGVRAEDKRAAGRDEEI